jgi:hypothetical protein
MKRRIWQIVVMLLALCFAAAIYAQSATEPALHRRGDRSTTDHPVVVKEGKTNSLIPEEASGEYMLGHPGELVEITIQFGELSGYISRQGDGESDSGTPLTFFFDKSSLQGQEIAFATRQIHGIWYSFRGTIVRGSGRTREEEGYYLLTGDLIEHNTAQKTESRTVSLKSGRQLG